MYLYFWLALANRGSTFRIAVQLQSHDVEGWETFPGGWHQRWHGGKQARVHGLPAPWGPRPHEGHRSAGEQVSSPCDFIKSPVTVYLSYGFFFLQETIEDIDKNGDGLIDLQEYIGKEMGTACTSWLCLSSGFTAFEGCIWRPVGEQNHVKACPNSITFEGCMKCVLLLAECEDALLLSFAASCVLRCFACFFS